MNKVFYKSWTFWSTFAVAVGSVWLVFDPSSTIAQGLLGIAIPSTAFGIRKAL